MNTVSARTTAEWRAWLAQNCQSEREICLVIYHKDSGTPSVRYHEAIEHALCYGWIDGLHRKHDANSSQLRFTPRSPRSAWSWVNRERAARMIEQGLMTEHGQALIDVAKAKGTWEAVPETVPDDLRELLDQNEAARTNFEKFPPSSKRLIQNGSRRRKSQRPGSAESMKRSRSRPSTSGPITQERAPRIHWRSPTDVPSRAHQRSASAARSVRPAWSPRRSCQSRR